LGRIGGDLESVDGTVFISYARENAEWAGAMKRDLEEAGHRCWVDTSDIQPGSEWEQRIADAIATAYAFVVLVSAVANVRPWVARERRMARRRDKAIFPVRVENVDLPADLAGIEKVDLFRDYQGALDRLLAVLPAPGRREPAAAPLAEQGPRDRELAYLRRLELRELQHVDLYTPLAGTAELGGDDKAPLPMLVARPELEHCPFDARGEARGSRQTRRFYQDITEAFPTPEIRRAVLLGPPGAGKTTTLWRLAADLAARAREDEQAPLPLLIKLGDWQNPSPFEVFLATQVEPLGGDLAALLENGRAALLLDGLNELPTGAWASRAAVLERWLNTRAHSGLLALATCRQDDYGKDLALDLDTIALQPLSIERIRDFAQRYLTTAQPEDLAPAERMQRGTDESEAFFWAVAGGAAVQRVWEKWQAAGAELERFFSAREIPRENPDVYGKTSLADDRIWHEHVASPRSLVRLARNPYMLVMLLGVYLRSGTVPANRGLLFRYFVETLLEREGLARRDPASGSLVVEATGVRLLDAVGRMAWSMQRYGEAAGHAAAVTRLPQQDAALHLDAELHRLALSASLIEPTGGYIRFGHQLLQEYFVALGMQAKLTALELDASELWPQERWWERSGWEEAAVLLAGLYPQDCTAVIDWLLDAQPWVAGQCLARSGARVVPDTLARVRNAWTPRLTDLERDPDPAARAAIGQALGVEVNGALLDPRPGVGVFEDPKTGLSLPDIDWVEVPAGDFLYQDGERRKLSAFRIARYPVTNAQFEAFVGDPQGFASPGWWEGLAERSEEPQQPAWSEGNCPRETVSWYEAVAFCRWLSARLGREVRLPHEWEWEKAARGSDGREYPWGDFYRAGFANIDETEGGAGPTYLARTTAVGLYPQGASPCGALDMAGNVWEWCLNEYDKPERTDTTGEEWRVVRGGSWGYARGYARVSYRDVRLPGDRDGGFGFRVVCVSPISSGH
jgi:hypothetical protein